MPQELAQKIAGNQGKRATMWCSKIRRRAVSIAIYRGEKFAVDNQINLDQLWNA
jgi:hypothetical protein